jgi:hypothetical protein
MQIYKKSTNFAFLKYAQQLFSDPTYSQTS